MTTPTHQGRGDQNNRRAGRGSGRGCSRGHGTGRSSEARNNRTNHNQEEEHANQSKKYSEPRGARYGGRWRGRGASGSNGRIRSVVRESDHDDQPGNNGNLDVNEGRGRQRVKGSGKGRQQKPKELKENSDAPSAKQPGQNKNRRAQRNQKQQCGDDSSNKTGPALNVVDNNKKPKRKPRTKKIQYETHQSHSTCLQRYNNQDPSIICGKIRVMPAKNGAAFVTCDRGSLSRDILIVDELSRNRALDGDNVFVELLPLEQEENNGKEKKCEGDLTLGQFMERLGINEGGDEVCDAELNDLNDKVVDGNTGEDYEDDVEYEEYLINDVDADGNENHADDNHGVSLDETPEMWHDDEVQMSLWDPVVNLRRKTRGQSTDMLQQNQRRGKVICVVPPKSTAGKSELTPADESYREKKASRTIVGTLAKLQDGNNRYLFSPNNKALPRFMCPANTSEALKIDDENKQMLYKAEYIYGTWAETNKWPPCIRVTQLCGACNVEDETKALLVEHDVDHGEFPPAVLKDVDDVVKSGRFVDRSDKHSEDEMGWKPTFDMLKGRRDYRNHRVFTIDPTTARDLDDALHITELPDGRVEIGVHIADVSHFVKPESAVDEEALRRATTVYLVDRVLPMLPRPLCEIACSLNENVERLAFSCVWTMNIDGTMSNKKGKTRADEVWYGRTVIKSCSRLDYATAQNIIDRKVATGEECVNEEFWPKSRQPTGGHTINEVAKDVRLMHKVAMARRKLRFENGALALNGIKLTFQLEDDGETPKMALPYPIRDSNRLIEEYMLLANFLVAQRLITHAKGRALLRQHSPPLEAGLQNVVEVSKESFNFDIDVTNSQTLQESLSRLGRTCDDELVIQCVTESLMMPMRPAEYIAAGEVSEEDWQHFALNIPYYTHFTSPIRRYADIVVHRLLQATLDDSVDDCPPQKQIHADAMHCNDKRMASKKAQERSDRVFLSLYLKKNPMESALGVCLGIGEKTFTVFVPSLGFSTRVFLDEHVDLFDFNIVEDDGVKRKLVIRPKSNIVPGMQSAEDDAGLTWKSLDVSVFTKLTVACFCKERTPIDVRVMVVGPWVG